MPRAMASAKPAMGVGFAGRAADPNAGLCLRRRTAYGWESPDRTRVIDLARVQPIVLSQALVSACGRGRVALLTVVP